MQKMRTSRSYSELLTFKSFFDRFNYLLLNSVVGNETFGFDRYINQVFYRSPEWKSVRNKVILRDEGCDLGVPGYEITGRILIHHMNPITVEDIESRRSEILNPEFLICVSSDTHNALHYGDESLLNYKKLVVRRQNDTCPWKQ